MKLSEFIENEEKDLKNLFIIEQLKDDSENVKIKFYKGGNCNCKQFLIIPKSLIEDVEVTDIKKECCGKTHKIVKIKFEENAKLSLNELIINQFNEKYTNNEDEHHKRDEVSFLNYEASSRNFNNFYDRVRGGKKHRPSHFSFPQDDCYLVSTYLQTCPTCPDGRTESVTCRVYQTSDGRYCRTDCDSCLALC